MRLAIRIKNKSPVCYFYMQQNQWCMCWKRLILTLIYRSNLVYDENPGLNILDTRNIAYEFPHEMPIDLRLWIFGYR